jgi:hypothetical protein
MITDLRKTLARAMLEDRLMACCSSVRLSANGVPMLRVKSK